MTTDLEQRVRDALRHHADAVTPESLRHPRGPRTSPVRRPIRWMWLAPVTAVAAVLIVVVGIAAVVSGSGSHSTKTGSGHPAASRALAGTDWRLATVRDPRGRSTSIPDRVGADIAFERDGTALDGHDGVNAYSAGYTVDGSGDLTLRPAQVTSIGYVGRDPARLAAIAGVGAVLSSAGAVTVAVVGRQLRLSAAGYTLTFRYAAPLATSSAPAPRSS